MIVDAGGKEVVTANSEPSVMRGANWFFEALRVGPEETGRYFVGLGYVERKGLLGDIMETMMFMREMFNIYDQAHLGLTTDKDVVNENAVEVIN